MTYRKMTQILRARGWAPVRQRGSHQQWKSPSQRRTFTVKANHLGHRASPNVIRNFCRDVLGETGSTP